MLRCAYLAPATEISCTSSLGCPLASGRPIELHNDLSLSNSNQTSARIPTGCSRLNCSCCVGKNILHPIWQLRIKHHKGASFSQLPGVAAVEGCATSQLLFCNLSQAANGRVLRYSAAAAAAECLDARADVLGKQPGRHTPVSKCCAAPWLLAPTPPFAPN